MKKHCIEAEYNCKGGIEEITEKMRGILFKLEYRISEWKMYKSRWGMCRKRKIYVVKGRERGVGYGNKRERETIAVAM